MSVATGTVQVNVNGFSVGQATLDASGTGTLQYTPNAGDVPQDTVTGNYSGDENFNSNSGTLELPVNNPAKTTPTVTITASPNPAIAGQPVTLTIVVA